VKAAKEQVAAMQRREAALIKMSADKAAAAAKFTEKWMKSAMAKIEKSMAPKKAKKRRKAKKK
ncbi:MAG: hypothetical protein KAU21_15105, partial [Gammaproteobacteria bacterium]|nr:hypothetical protein [Gammaproteobacteria bacterium]